MKREILRRIFRFSSIAIFASAAMGWAAFAHAGVFKHVNVNGVRATEANSGWMIGSSAVGPNHLFQIKSGQMKICSKSGTCDTTVSVKSRLFQNPPFQVSQCYYNLADDAQVIYDSLADRWVVVATSTDMRYPGVCFAVSTSADPRGSYRRHFFLLTQYPENARPSHPRLGLWSDGYYVTFSGVVNPRVVPGEYPLFVFPRTELLSGATPPEPLFFTVPEAVSYPGNLVGPDAPPSGMRNHLYSMAVRYYEDPDHGSTPIAQGINARRIVVDWNNRANSNASTLMYLPFGADNETGIACGADTHHRCIPQPHPDPARLGEVGPFIGTGVLWGALNSPINYRNMGSYSSVLISHDYDINQGHWPWLWESIAWHELRFSASTPYLYQIGRMETLPDTGSRFASSLAMNKNGDIALGYNHSDHTEYVNVRVSGRRRNDPSGEMTQGEATMVTSASVIDSSTVKAFYWGHNQMTVDPDGCTFWFFANYVRSRDWATRISSATLPDCNMAKGRPVRVSSSESSTYAGSRAVDGNTGTRWSSAFSDNQWIRVDLGSTTKFTKVVLRWEAAYAREYKIQTSLDGSAWTDVYSTTNGLGGVETLTVNATGRYVRMLARKRATSYGYSLYEFEVYGQ